MLQGAACPILPTVRAILRSESVRCQRPRKTFQAALSKLHVEEFLHLDILYAEIGERLGLGGVTKGVH